MYLVTHSGIRIDPYRPLPKQINIEDIARGLSMTCRFNGQCAKFYSVAEHCLHVANTLVEETGNLRMALLGLLHDATEAYLPDTTTPVKYTSHFIGARELESIWEETIYAAFAIIPPSPEEKTQIKAVDRHMLYREWMVLMPPDPSVPPVDPLGLLSLDMEAIRMRYLQYFQAYGGVIK